MNASTLNYLFKYSRSYSQFLKKVMVKMKRLMRRVGWHMSFFSGSVIPIFSLEKVISSRDSIFSENGR